jgi:hypothetical protein
VTAALHARPASAPACRIVRTFHAGLPPPARPRRGGAGGRARSRPADPRQRHARRNTRASTLPRRAREAVSHRTAVARTGTERLSIMLLFGFRIRRLCPVRTNSHPEFRLGKSRISIQKIGKHLVNPILFLNRLRCGSNPNFQGV